MDYSTPGLPVHHRLLELTQLMFIESMPSNHLILCCPLLLLPSVFPSIRVFSSDLGLFQWPHQVAKVLELQLQHQCFQWIFRVDFLSDWMVWSLCHPRDSRESSPDYPMVWSNTISSAGMNQNYSFRVWLWGCRPKLLRVLTYPELPAHVAVTCSRRGALQMF